MPCHFSYLSFTSVLDRSSESYCSIQIVDKIRIDNSAPSLMFHFSFLQPSLSTLGLIFDFDVIASVMHYACFMLSSLFHSPNSSNSIYRYIAIDLSLFLSFFFN